MARSTYSKLVTRIIAKWAKELYGLTVNITTK